jgi:DNA polymerase III sliding clamp (beta) subunit (PCNA family)
MRIMIKDVNVWQKALDRVAQAVDNNSKSSHPLHSHVRIRVAENSVEILAQDGIVAAVTHVPVESAENGGCCVPLRVFRAVLSAAPISSVYAELHSPGDLRFSASHWKSDILVRPLSDMGDFPTPPSDFLSLPAGILRRAVELTIHAASTDEDRADLACVSFRCKNGRLEALSTDGFRACYAKILYEGEFAGPMVVYERGLREVKKVSEEEGVTRVDVGMTANHLFFRTSSTSVAIPRLSKKIADVSKIFERNSACHVRLPRAELLRALADAVAITGNQKMTIRMTSEGVEITSQAPERGSVSVEIFGNRLGEASETMVDAKFLREAAQAIGGEFLWLETAGPQAAFFVRPCGSDEVEAAIMPFCHGS